MEDSSLPPRVSKNKQSDLDSRIALFLKNDLSEDQALELIEDLNKKYPIFGVEMEEKCSCGKPYVFTFASGPACLYSRYSRETSREAKLENTIGCGIVSGYNALAPKGSKMPKSSSKVETN